MLVEYKDLSNIKIFVFSNYMHFKLITKHVLTLDKEKCNLMATKVLFDDKCIRYHVQNEAKNNLIVLRVYCYVT